MKIDKDKDKIFSEQSIETHLFELRSRLIKIIIGMVIFFFVLFPFRGEVYSFIAKPFLSALPQGDEMIATGVLGPFMVPLKVTFMAAFILSLPITLYQVWRFISPALYKHEKKIIFPLVISSILLFFIGMAFCYYVLFPMLFHLVSSMRTESFAIATEIGEYVSFINTMFILFGTAFNVPIFVVVLNLFGILPLEKLYSIRPFVIVGAFVIAAIVTPPDVISQIMLAIPLVILYEVGVFICRFMNKKKK